MASIKIRTQRFDAYTEVKVLITHPMENGRNRDPFTNALIPAHFIERLSLDHNDTAAVTVDTTGSVSANPFFTFRLKSVAAGDRLTLRWRDNRQQTDRYDYIVP